MTGLVTVEITTLEVCQKCCRNDVFGICVDCCEYDSLKLCFSCMNEMFDVFVAELQPSEEITKDQEEIENGNDKQTDK